MSAQRVFSTDGNPPNITVWQHIADEPRRVRLDAVHAPHLRKPLRRQCHRSTHLQRGRGVQPVRPARHPQCKHHEPEQRHEEDAQQDGPGNHALDRHDRREHVPPLIDVDIKVATAFEIVEQDVVGHGGGHAQRRGHAGLVEEAVEPAGDVRLNLLQISGLGRHDASVGAVVVVAGAAELDHAAQRHDGLAHVAVVLVPCPVAAGAVEVVQVVRGGEGVDEGAVAEQRGVDACERSSILDLFEVGGAFGLVAS